MLSEKECVQGGLDRGARESLMPNVQPRTVTADVKEANALGAKHYQLVLVCFLFVCFQHSHKLRFFFFFS